MSTLHVSNQPSRTYKVEYSGISVSQFVVSPHEFFWFLQNSEAHGVLYAWFKHWGPHQQAGFSACPHRTVEVFSHSQPNLRDKRTTCMYLSLPISGVVMGEISLILYITSIRTVSRLLPFLPGPDACTPSPGEPRAAHMRTTTTGTAHHHH